MSVFGNYSKYYNLLYKDKDYEGEAEYIFSLIQKYNPVTELILELGCGTGKHAKIIAEKGYKIHGIDSSQTMLQEALSIENQNLFFEQGDVRTFRANKKFDCVISLFHVASYQNSNEDVINYFKTAGEHLSVGGLFIFDVWFAPCVLNEKPERRVKELENEEIKIKRIAEPFHRVNENVIDVNYKIEITDKKSSRQDFIQEKHSMRYFSLPEISLFCSLTGFELVSAEEWLTGHEPGESTWGVCFVARSV
jgi:trans-aconitate methyltransferase